jgi:hypothetical protein
MDQQPSGPGSVPTGERMKELATAIGSSIVHKIKGDPERDQKGAAYRVERSVAEAILEDWPPAPKRVGRQMIEQYGPPNVATPVDMRWYYAGPWKRIELTRDEIAHNFPATHTDFLTLWIDYQVPIDKFDEIARFDGSCLVDRTAGEVGARCDTEAADTITLNLMHDIVTGKYTVEEARERYTQEMSAYGLGRPAPYAEGLLFQPPREGTMDPDINMMGHAALHQTAQKVLDAVAGEPKAGEPLDRNLNPTS